MSARSMGITLLAAAMICVAWRATLAQLEDSSRDAASEPDDETLQILSRRVNTFLVSIAKDELDQEWNTLLQGSPLKRDQKKLDQLRDAIRRETQRYGSFREVEQLKLESQGQSLATIVCLYKCQEYPLVWSFTFYRAAAEQEWTLISLRFHVDYEQL